MQLLVQTCLARGGTAPGARTCAVARLSSFRRRGRRATARVRTSPVAQMGPSHPHRHLHRDGNRTHPSRSRRRKPSASRNNMARGPRTTLASASSTSSTAPLTRSTCLPSPILRPMLTSPPPPTRTSQILHKDSNSRALPVPRDRTSRPRHAHHRTHSLTHIRTVKFLHYHP